MFGTNYLQLPINQPKVAVHNNQRDGAMSTNLSCKLRA
ncbi:catalase [Paenisporosarcina sp. TG-14]